MKKLIAILFSTFFALTLCVGASAASIQKASVTGEGSVLVNADRFALSFSFETKGSDTDKVRSASASLDESIKRELSSFGELTSEGYYSFLSSDGEMSVTRSYTIMSKRVTEVSVLTEKLIRLGATCICSPVYSLSSPEEHEQKALKLAIEDAKRRAAACGIKGDPTYLRDLGDRPDCCRFCYTPDPSGKVRVECRVILGFNNS